ncbi:hypothetical protein NON00_02395 [Roseomonas sp. GC11]|nr:hypothetical protein [Roseomonas sp. GC11]MCQ4158777.1 hypothetical protein [Roseomonas sp. GC11]
MKISDLVRLYDRVWWKAHGLVWGRHDAFLYHSLPAWRRALLWLLWRLP